MAAWAINISHFNTFLSIDTNVPSSNLVNWNNFPCFSFVPPDFCVVETKRNYNNTALTLGSVLIFLLTNCILHYDEDDVADVVAGAVAVFDLVVFILAARAGFLLWRKHIMVNLWKQWFPTCLTCDPLKWSYVYLWPLVTVGKSHWMVASSTKVCLTLEESQTKYTILWPWFILWAIKGVRTPRFGTPALKQTGFL